MKEKEPLLISECLCGVTCRYDGGHNEIPELEELRNCYRLVPCCPEVLGGLLTPRVPVELCEGRAITKTGDDVTKAFKKGAEEALRLARCEGCTQALLKAKSPSCGKGYIYDGSHSRTLIVGNGMTAELLLMEGITVITEKEVDRLL